MSAQRPVGLGVVGTGGWARGFWSQGRHAPEVKVVACWDVTEPQARRFSEQLCCEVAPSLEALLGHPEVEAVACFTPNNAHRQPAEAAAAAGKHVFTEKPIANTVEDAAAMILACREADVVLMVGHSARYGGAMRAMRQLLDREVLGQLAMAEANTSHSGGRRLSPEQWRWHRDEAPGGPLMQLSVHTFDTLHYLFGPTRQVMARSSSHLVPSEIEDVFLTVLELESGLLGYVGTNYVSPPANYLRVYGTDGTAHAEGGKLLHTRATDDWQTATDEVAAPEVNVPAAEMAEFARAIRTGTEPETGGREGLLALGVARAALISAAEGRAVEVAEALGEAAGLAG